MLVLGLASEVATTELLIGAEPAIRTLSDLWYNAKEEGVHLVVEGYDVSPPVLVPLLLTAAGLLSVDLPRVRP